MEKLKEKLNLKIVIPIILVLVIAIVGIVALTNRDNDNQENKKEMITGNWKIDIIQDDTTFERIVDGFIDNWYSDSTYLVGNTLNDIKIFKDTNKDYYCWIANVNIYVKENYKNDGSIYYKMSNDSSAQLKEMYLRGYCKFYEDTAGELRTFNKDYTSTHVIDIYESYEDVLNATLKLCEFSSETELTCIVDNTLVQEFKQKVIENNNIYNEMRNLIKANKLDEAKNLYYKNTNLTKGQSEKCLLLYAKNYELYMWGGSKVEINGNTETGNKNDYIIFIYKNNNWLADKNIYITVNVEDKTYKTTKTI
ncbi:MAG: hypothetical protein ACI4PE_04695 [Bacilli bacterium]